MRVCVNGVFKEVESGLIRVGGAWKPLSSVRVYVSGAWKDGKTFVPPLSVTVSPTGVNGDTFNYGTAVTNNATATPSGGLAPYTYSWARVGAGSGTVDSPSAASTGFIRVMGVEETAVETFRVTVTDSTSQTATADVLATFTSF